MARFEDTEEGISNTLATFIRDSGRVIISVMGDLLIVLLYKRVWHRLREVNVTHLYSTSI